MKLCLKDMRSYSFPLILTALPSLTAYASPFHAPSSTSETQLRDIRLPSYKNAHPQWALELTSSLNALGGNALTVDQGTHPIYAFSFLGEYQPSFFQNYGVLGIGPSFNIYPAFGSGITHSILGLYGAGGQIRYQMRYFREQPIVPVFAYSAEYFSYQFNNGVSGGFVSMGPTIGMWLLLNFLDTDAASQLYMDTGVSRTYVALEYRSMTGRDSQISVSGGSIYFGLRFEF